MLIPIYRVIASQFPVDSLTGDVEPGFVMGLTTNASGVTVARKTDLGGGGNNVTNILGISGDRKRASEAYEWVNRVSDSGDETAGSGKITIYHGGGEFYVDVDDSNVTTPLGSTLEGVISSAATVTVGNKLYACTANGGTKLAGQMDSTSSGDAVALILSEAAALDSGIPGEYEPGSSVGYVDPSVPRTWVQIKLLV